jgi:hypothetical protein
MVGRSGVLNRLTHALGDRDWSGEQIGRKDAGLVPGTAKAKRYCGVIDLCKAV